MTQPSDFVPALRLHLLLCASAAVLAACGGSDGGADDATAAAADANRSTAMAAHANADAQAAITPASANTTAASPEEQITELYLALLHRAPDAAGLAYWTQALRNGASIDAIAEAIKTSPEYQQLQAGSYPLPPATTHNYYVSANTGSDSWPGTQAQPFKTLARAVKAVTQPSTTVWVAPGTYAGGIKTTVSGSATGRIYWRSTTRWGARIVPPASSSNNSAWDNRGHYVSITGFDVDGSQAGSGTPWLHGIYTGGSYSIIQYNRVHHLAVKVPCTSAGGSAIGVDSYYHGVKGDVLDNMVHDVGPTGCRYVQGIYMSTSGTVKDNVVFRIGQAAIHLWHDANDVKIINNTVSSSVFGIIVGGGDFYFNTAGANNVHVHNNIVFDNTYGISEQGKTGTSNTYKNNLVYQNPSYNWRLQNGLQPVNTVSANPLFVAYSRTAPMPDFHLTSSSPAIGRGVSTYVQPTDFEGKPRNANTGYDIGAYQH
ncbi:DUF4214 domain-containing protein [Ideonella sp. BN130291]|uniref:DUF4214 domain-containing protein n=1 Tax=Ideonella sp. BN130291 TaxID=3112940 RepID=UPI002E2659D3|nr:DUF4214 domain-containing protein [Ideonella sp. BN130291]